VNAISTPVHLAAEPASAGRLTPRQLAFFHLLLPVLLSLPQGFSQMVGLGFSLPMSILWWAATWLFAWTGYELVSRAAALALRPWRPPVWVVLLIGVLVFGLASRWWTVPLFNLVCLLEEPPLADAYRQTARSFSDPEYVARLAQSLFSGVVAWLVANHLFERITGVPRFAASTAPRAWLERREVATPDEAPLAARTTGLEPSVPAPAGVPLAAAAGAPVSLPEPRFLARMTKYPGTRLEQVLAVEAEDHYIKVHTEAGAELVYYRFADALDDLRAHDGLRVHRSFWVRRGAIERVDASGRQWELVLRRDLRVPVSRANQGALRLAGLVR
jgi:hypothetical protein